MSAWCIWDKGKNDQYFARDNGTNCVKDVPISEIYGHTDEYFIEDNGTKWLNDVRKYAINIYTTEIVSITCQVGKLKSKERTSSDNETNIHTKEQTHDKFGLMINIYCPVYHALFLEYWDGGLHTLQILCFIRTSFSTIY